jgi:hypothetical protein
MMRKLRLLALVAFAAACGEPAEEAPAPAQRPVLHITVTSEDGSLPAGLELSVTGRSSVGTWTVEHEGKLPPDGNVTIEGLAPGEATAELRGDGFERELTFYVAAHTPTELLVPVPRGATVEGTVSHRESGPLAGAKLRIRFRHATYEDKYSVEAGADGRFRLARLPAGSHPVNIWHESLARYGSWPRAVIRVPGPARQDIVLGRRELKGVLRSRDTDAPAGGLIVTVRGSSGLAVTQAAPDGTFRFEDLLPGRARLTALGDGRLGMQPVEIPEDGVLEIEVEVAKQ